MANLLKERWENYYAQIVGKTHEKGCGGNSCGGNGSNINWGF
jgi:hypothetical protein